MMLALLPANAFDALARGMLLADVDDWVRLAIIIVPIILYALNSLLGGRAKKAAAPQRPQQAPPRPQIDEEVEQFLKRAAERRAGAGQRVEPLLPPTPPPRKPAPQRAAHGAREVITATVAEERRGADLSSLANRPAFASEFDQRAAKLSQLASQEGQRFTQHVREAFDHKVGQFESHQVGTLAGRFVETGATAQTRPVSADVAAVLATLRDPLAARRAIILAEILARPEHRW